MSGGTKHRQSDVAGISPQMLREAKKADRLIEKLGRQRFGDDLYERMIREPNIPTPLLRQDMEIDRLLIKELAQQGEHGVRSLIGERKQEREALGKSNRLQTGIAGTKLTIDWDEIDEAEMRKELRGKKTPEGEISKQIAGEAKRRARRANECKALVEAILPGAWDEFRTICGVAQGAKNLADQNKTAALRSEWSELRNLAVELRDRLEKAARATRMAIPADFPMQLENAVDVLTNLEQEAGALPEGKQPLEYRDYLARKVAKLMRQYGIEPGTGGGRKGVSPFKRLVQQGLDMVEGRRSIDVRPILERALKEVRD